MVQRTCINQAVSLIFVIGVITVIKPSQTSDRLPWFSKNYTFYIMLKHYSMAHP